MTISEFLDMVKEIYADHFPDSACSAKLVKILGKSIFIDFYLAKDKTEVSNSIWQNDVSIHIMMRQKTLNFLENESSEDYIEIKMGQQSMQM